MESRGNAASLRAGMWCKPGRRPPTSAPPGEPLLNRSKRVRGANTRSFCFSGDSGLDVGPDTHFLGKDCAATRRAKPSASAPTCERRPSGLRRRHPAAPRPGHFLSAVHFGMGYPAPTLGRQKGTRPAESARRGGLQSGGAKGHRGQGGEHRRQRGARGAEGSEEVRRAAAGAGSRGGGPSRSAVGMAAMAVATAGVSRPCILAPGLSWTLRDRGASAAPRSCCRGPSKSNASSRARAAGSRRTAGPVRWWARAPGARRSPGWPG